VAGSRSEVKVASNITPPLPIADRVATAGQLVVRTRIFLDLWDFYHGPSRGGILNTLNKFSEFFRFDEHAHRFSFFIHAAALFEKKPNTINLHQLTNELHNADRISDEQKAEITQLFASVTATVKGVHLVRNKAFAHRDNSIPFIINILLIACAPITSKYLPQLPLDDARAILTALSRA
jgi:AbiU2